MFEPQIAALRFAAKSAARRITMSAVGGLFLLLALVFLGVAAWVALANDLGTIGTALVFAAIFAILGLLALALSRYPPRVVPARTAREMQNPMQSPALSTAAIINAVVMGIAAGRAVRRDRRRD